MAIDDAILQRQMPVPVWGWSEPGIGGYAALRAGEKWGDLVLAAQRGSVVGVGDFVPIPGSTEDAVVLPEGFTFDVLIRPDRENW